MAEVILMPRLSDTMTEGVIASWNKKVGDTVKKGDVLAEIETDKATMELESYKDGVLLHIGTEKGGKLQVNDLLAIIGSAGEDVSSLISQHSGNSSGQQSTDNSQQPSEANEKQENNNTTNNTKSQQVLNNEKQETGNEKSEKQETSNKANEKQTKNENVNMDDVVLMPRLSDTMTEGVIASWQKNIGDTVKKGDVLADIETDKATMELDSYKDGVLLYQGAKAGEKVQVNDLLCIIGREGTNVDEIVNAVKNGTSQQSTDNTNNNKSQTSSSEKQENSENNEKQETKKAENEKQETHNEIVNNGRILASPLAKKLAAEKGVDLKYIKGSADGGRIVKADVDAYTPQATGNIQQVEEKQETNKKQETKNESTNQQFTDTPVSQMRKVIAKRLSESLFTAPHFYLTMSINMDAAVDARTKLNADGKTKISFNDMVIKATAMALKLHPKVNSSWMGDFIRTNHVINIGVAVAMDEGLLVPVVRNADGLSFTQIGSKVKDFAQKAKDKKLQPQDWEGNTFTISNLGMFGIEQFTAIINPPDSCILAVGGINQEPVVKNGNIVVGNIMKVTLSCDHRVVDGATGAAFLQTLKSYLEEPLKMLA